jgi:hypothetical protein
MVHATDRLVSLRHRTRFEPKYPVFNKSVIYRATDAIVTIGFTGLAILERKPTDEWIASTLAGVEFDPIMGVSFGQRFDALILVRRFGVLRRGSMQHTHGGNWARTCPSSLPAHAGSVRAGGVWW